VTCAESWDDLDRLLANSIGECVILDPSADGTPKVRLVETIFHKHPSAHFVAYVNVTPANLKAVFALAKHGLGRVFVHPLPGSVAPWREFLERESYLRMSRIVYATAEGRFSLLSPKLGRAIEDLFERPQRYASAKDIAREARVPTKSMYLEFAQAGLLSPKALITLSKTVAGYGDLVLSAHSVSAISKKLGFADQRTFIKHLAALGANACRRSGSDWDDILVEAIERLHKPSAAAPAMYGGQASSKPSRKSQNQRELAVSSLRLVPTLGDHASTLEAKYVASRRA
jgi:AraC-like DNA-binding protein